MSRCDEKTIAPGRAWSASGGMEPRGAACDRGERRRTESCWRVSSGPFALRKMQSKHYIGIDEVGRGSWAGPVVIAAVFFPDDLVVPDDVVIRDSKVLSRPSRTRSAYFLRKNSTFCTLVVPTETVDQGGVHRAIVNGIRRICATMKRKISNPHFLIDGTRLCALRHSHEFIIHGDSLIREIAAASIIAKDFRDRYMARMEKIYPGYGFDRHVGYGTQFHQDALQRLGVSPIHRRSFAPIRRLCTEAE